MSHTFNSPFPPVTLRRSPLEAIAEAARGSSDGPVPPLRRGWEENAPVTDRSLWSYNDIAAHIKVRTDTVRSYRKHGLLPPPDHVENGKPYWYADTIRAWVASRPSNNRGRNRE